MKREPRPLHSSGRGGHLQAVYPKIIFLGLCPVQRENQVSSTRQAMTQGQPRAGTLGAHRAVIGVEVRSVKSEWLTRVGLTCRNQAVSLCTPEASTVNMGTSLRGRRPNTSLRKTRRQLERGPASDVDLVWMRAGGLPGHWGSSQLLQPPPAGPSRDLGWGEGTTVVTQGQASPWALTLPTLESTGHWPKAPRSSGPSRGRPHADPAGWALGQRHRRLQGREHIIGR